MKTVRHELSGAEYSLMADGLIRVTKDGLEGRFRDDGKWVAGDLKAADPHMCEWVAALGKLAAAEPSGE